VLCPIARALDEPLAWPSPPSGFRIASGWASLLKASGDAAVRPRPLKDRRLQLVFGYRVAPQLRQVGVEPEAMGIFQMMALELCYNLVEPALSKLRVRTDRYHPSLLGRREVLSGR
jgi:hypothetical protein